VLTEEKFWCKPEQIVTSFDSSVWFGKSYTLRWYKVAKFCPCKTTAARSLLRPGCETNFDTEGNLVFSGLLDSEPLRTAKQ
jgi:hypothetical protein